MAIEKKEILSVISIDVRRATLSLTNEVRVMDGDEMISNTQKSYSITPEDDLSVFPSVVQNIAAAAFNDPGIKEVLEAKKQYEESMKKLHEVQQ